MSAFGSVHLGEVFVSGSSTVLAFYCKSYLVYLDSAQSIARDMNYARSSTKFC